MRFFLSVFFVLVSSNLAWADFEILGGGRYSTAGSQYLPAPSLSTFSNSYPSVTCFEGMILLGHQLGNSFKIQGGIEYKQFCGEFQTTGTAGAQSANGTETSVEPTFGIPILLSLYLGPVFKVIVGGDYWTAYANYVSGTGIDAGAASNGWGNGSGFSERTGVGFEINKRFDVRLMYEFSTQLSQAQTPVTSSSTGSETISAIVLDLGVIF